ncbi:unnamed protein product [Orchesella dallaii]|uniref:C2H2-type domain-containing protein n=1 Tax=Orchesella dallaii TaxID=48710 RepID=A0ABP1S7M7_9HEXA
MEQDEDKDEAFQAKMMAPLPPLPSPQSQSSSSSSPDVKGKGNKLFIAEMDKSISEVINECVQVLQKDPREYHPFYLRTHKYVTLGVEKGYFKGEAKVESVWKKWDKYAVSQYKKSVSANRRKKKMEEEEEFDGPRSSYLRYILENKVYHGDKVIDIPRNEYQRKKKFKELEEMQKKLAKEAKGTNIRDDLKTRRAFFEHCKSMTFPGDVVKMNLLWTLFLTSADDSESEEEAVEDVEDKEEEEEVEKQAYSRWKPKVDKDDIYYRREMMMTAARKRVDDAKSKRREKTMTEEEKNDYRKRRNESKRRKRARMTEEERDAMRKMQNESRKKRMEKMTEEEKTVCRDRHREKMKLKRKCNPDSEEVARKKKERKEELRKQKYAEMTEDELNELKMKKYMYYVAYKAKLTKEDRLRMNRMKREQVKRSMTEEKKQAMTEWQRQWRHSLKGDKRERYIESVRKAVKKNWDRIKSNPEKYEKVKEKLNERQRKIVASETPEQRQKRLQRMRRYSAKKRLKKQHPGLSDQEIERKVEEFMATVVPTPIGAYQPRPQARKPKKEVSSSTKVSSKSPSPTLSPTPPPVTRTRRTYQNKRLQNHPPHELPTPAAPPILPPPHINTQTHPVCEYTLPYVSIPTGETGTGTTQFSLQFQPPPHNLMVEEKNQFCQIVNYSSVEPGCSTTTTSFYIPIETTTPNAEQFIQLSTIPETTCPASDSVSVDESSYHQDYDDDNDDFSPCELSEPPPLTPPSCAPPPPPQNNERISTPAPPTLQLELNQEQESPPVPPEEASVEDINNSQQKSKRHEKTKMCEECGGLYSSHYIQAHKDSHDPNSKVKCPQCPLEFRRGRGFWHHFARVHLQQDCDIDEEGNSNDGGGTSRHHQASKVPISFTCSICQQPYDSDANLKRHMYFSHGDGSNPTNFLVCPYCPKKFKQKCTLDDHIRRTHDGVADYRCDICGRDLQSAGKLWKHKVNYHKMTDLPPPPELEVITCEYCDEMVLRGYETHVKKRHPDMLSEFLKKNGSFPMPDVALSNEILGLPPGPNPYVICPVCQKEFRRSSLKRHLRNVHGKGKTKRFECQICRKVFKERYNLTEHLQCVHSKDSDPDSVSDVKSTRNPSDMVQCHICFKQLMSSSMVRHMQSKHPEGNGDERRFPCPKCGKEFKEKYHLKEHIIDVHEDIDEKIKAKKLFKLFLDRQSNSKKRINYKCVLCGDKGKGKHQMRAHLVTVHPHLYENLRKSNSLISLDCGECSESFGNEEEIRSHFESAHKDKCIRCPECSLVFLSSNKSSSTELQDHMRLTHDGNEDKEILQEVGMPRVRTKTGKSRRKKKPSIRFKYNCMRCDGDEGKFNQLEELSGHVKDKHPQNFWPCAYCKLMRYTERGLLFHRQMCKKRPRTDNEKEDGKLKKSTAKSLRNGQEEEEKLMMSFDRMPVACEICGKEIRLYSLSRHFLDVHGVKEEGWNCHICQKDFKRREYWISHMDVQHSGVGVDIDELVKKAVKLNVKDMSSLKILNIKGTKGNSEGKSTTTNKIKVEVNQDGRRKRRGKGGGVVTKRRARRVTRAVAKRKRQWSSESEDDDDDDEDEEEEGDDITNERETNGLEKQVRVRMIRLTEQEISEYIRHA